MPALRRLRAWAIERLGGELPYDWDMPSLGPPDYYVDGLPVYDMSKRLHALAVEHKSALSQVMEFHARETQRFTDWLAEDGS